MWILFTLLAAFAQSWRNALQSRLSTEVKASGVTLARFLYAGPIAAVYLSGLYLWRPTDLLSPSWPLVQYVIGAALMQIVATALMVRLFQMRNFAVGAGLAKSEALMAAVLGTLFFGTSLSWLGWLGVLLGAIAVMLLSSKGGLKQLSLSTIVTGLLCGTAFALTSLWVRQASLTINLPFPHRAAWVLLLVIGLQTLLLLAYLRWRDHATLQALWQRPKLTLAVSVTSCVGSIGWFSAMALEAVPLVKTLGQIEVFFTLMIAALWLKQRPKINDVLGLGLIAVAAILVMWS
ncbi:DMT family transporter [uncultured Ferrimonas sp.]|uniref:DMT family transporter n=1 Tax=uncultured Ferrimonas sp. TaxID=432640 RepID=UPI00261A1B9A|nr:DMT family transporter [uncultured Ferrimonas sp.]